MDSERRRSFEGVEKESKVVLSKDEPAPFYVETKISEDKLGSIFRAQQLVRHSLTV